MHLNYKDNRPDSLLYFVWTQKCTVFKVSLILRNETPAFANSFHVKKQCPEALELCQSHCLQSILVSLKSERNLFQG